MRRDTELKLAGWSKRKDGKWINPLTKRPYTSERAINKVAKEAGYKSWKVAQATTKTANYKRFEGFAKDANLPTNLISKFQKLWLKAAKKNFKPGSDELDKILKFVKKRSNRSSWPPGESPKYRRR